MRFTIRLTDMDNVDYMIDVKDGFSINVSDDCVELSAKRASCTPLVRSITLEELDLSVRSYNCLKRNGINTVKELCDLRESELMTLRNLGKKSFMEIVEKLKTLGLHLRYGGQNG